MHLGLIGGIGPAATEYYYKGLVKAYASTDKILDLTIVHADTRTLLANLSNGAAQQQAEIFLEFILRLKGAGADVAVITSLAGHFCISELLEISPLPVINAIPLLDDYFASESLSRIGLLGTQSVMNSRLYGGVSSVEIVLPQGNDFSQVHQNYVDMATSGSATSQQKEFFIAAGRRMCAEQGAEAIALVGTDLFLVFDGVDCGFPVIDCARIHIDALLSISTGGSLD